MKIMKLVLLAILLVPGTARAEMKVVATLSEIGALATEIGGERVKVETLARGDEDPHSIAAKPSHSRRLSRADLLIYNGLELEIGWLPLLMEGARNSRIREDAPGHLNLSEFITPLEIPAQVDRSQGDVHPQGNPHYTVDPGLYPDLARAVALRLILLDPEGEEYYHERLNVFTTRWNERLGDWRRRLEFLSGSKVVAYHSQWTYAARRFGFEIVDHVENRPGIPPTPRHIIKLKKLIKQEEIPLLIYSDLIHPETPERFARKAGCRAVQLPQAVSSRSGTDNLFDWFELWVTLLANTSEES